MRSICGHAIPVAPAFGAVGGLPLAPSRLFGFAETQTRNGTGSEWDNAYRIFMPLFALTHRVCGLLTRDLRSGGDSDETCLVASRFGWLRMRSNRFKR